jgi:hypothetical protein
MKHIKLFEQFVNENETSYINESKETQNIANSIDVSEFKPRVTSWKEYIKVNRSDIHNGPVYVFSSMIAPNHYDHEKTQYELVSKDIEKFLENPPAPIKKWLDSVYNFGSSGSVLIHPGILDFMIITAFKHHPESIFLYTFAFFNQTNAVDLDYKKFETELNTTIAFFQKVYGRSINVENPRYQGLTGATQQNKKSYIKVSSKEIIDSLRNKMKKLFLDDKKSAYLALDKLSALNVTGAIRVANGLYSGSSNTITDIINSAT